MKKRQLALAFSLATLLGGAAMLPASASAHDNGNPNHMEHGPHDRGGDSGNGNGHGPGHDSQGGSTHERHNRRIHRHGHGWYLQQHRVVRHHGHRSHGHAHHHRRNHHYRSPVRVQFGYRVVM